MHGPAVQLAASTSARCRFTVSGVRKSNTRQQSDDTQRPVIPLIRLAEAFAAGQPIRLYAAKSRGAADFEQLAAHLTTHLTVALPKKAHGAISETPATE
jgi:cellulose biosynthesis protein BcsQ